MYLTSAHTPDAPQWLAGQPVLANSIRLFIIFIGFTLALVALKIGLRFIATREWERFFGAMSFALIVVTPSISGLFNFDRPLNPWTTMPYLAGLLLGIVACWFRFTLTWPWLHRLHRVGRRRRH